MQPTCFRDSIQVRDCLGSKLLPCKATMFLPVGNCNTILPVYSGSQNTCRSVLPQTHSHLRSAQTWFPHRQLSEGNTGTAAERFISYWMWLCPVQYAIAFSQLSTSLTCVEFSVFLAALAQGNSSGDPIVG
jgi:hypothetical protein